MKNRSHRLPISDPPDDWVDGSWTVDCVCGVNFDDGEEMVNCDECGVWVHTRCSRYVKSEKVFACDKCKSKKSSIRNDSEETEVAQLLVELPTKTLRMEKPYSVGGGLNRNPFQIWTDIPMEEKVHVQGIPGGDPALFGGLSSVFSPELWKCTGYVPKKFNFQYREFPCWDDEKKEDGKKGEEEIENPASKGAGVLFSLSKENVLGGMKKQAGGGPCDKLAQTTDRKKQDVEKSEVKRAHNSLKKERSSLKPIVVHSNKRKKEEFRTSRDHSMKKKARGMDKDRDSSKRGVHFSKSVAPNPSDAKQLEFNEGKDPNVVKTDKQSCKDGNSRSDLVANPLSDGCPEVENSAGNSSDKLITSQRPSEALALDVSGCNPSIEARLIEENVGHHIPLSVEIPPRADDGAASSLDHKDMETNPLKDKVIDDAISNVIDNGRDPITTEGVEPVGEDLATVAPVIRDNQICQDSIGEVLSSSLQPIEVKTEAKTDSPVETCNAKTSLSSNVMLDSSKSSAQLSSPFDPSPAAVEVNGASVAAMVARDQKVQIVSKSRLTVDCQADKADELASDHCQHKGQSPGSEGSLIGQKSSSEFKHGPAKLNGSVVSPSGMPNQRKAMVSVGKISSSSSAVVIPKPSVSETSRPANSLKHNSNIKQKGTSENNLDRKKDKTSTDALREVDGRERQKIIAKEPPKSSVTSAPKTSNLSKFTHAPVSKKTFSSSRDHVIQSSSRTSSVQKAAATPDSGESASSLQAENSLVQNKNTASSFSLRCEKINQANSQPASKNHLQSLHPPTPSNPPANLSDEELALLLHQELNSSPRVPRVPRIRHAGSLPQLASPTATSMLMKRTSSSGGKDGLARRKNKDLTKDGPVDSRELEDGAKTDKMSSNPDQKKHDPAGNVSPKVIHSADKSIPPASTTISSGPSSSNEANEQIMSSTRNSPRNASDDDIGNVGILTPRTLPGLIAEIMSKGQRMTYEELCNAVLPHWPNLRKHNGERYAYSSHSQAVLDCLRNRSEWSRLVDRGPKTNAGRKRRKHEVDPQNLEAEDNDYSKDRDKKDIDSKVFESHLNEVPRGKRKARKRSLALQGRRIKDVRRSSKADVCSDDTGSSSNSSEERLFSDEEIQGDETCPRVSEASASSEGMETMS